MRTKIFVNWLWLSFAVSNLDDHVHSSQVWIILWVKFFKRSFCGLNAHFTWSGWDAEGSMLSRFSRVQLFGDPMDCSPARLLCPWDSPGETTGVCCHFLLQRIFPAKGWNSSLISCIASGFFTCWATWEVIEGNQKLIDCQCLCILKFLIMTSGDYHRIQTSPRQTSLEVQWLRLYTSTTRGRGSVSGWGTKTPNAIWCSQENLNK